MTTLDYVFKMKNFIRTQLNFIYCTNIFTAEQEVYSKASLCSAANLSKLQLLHFFRLN